MKLLRTLLALSFMSFAFAGLARADDHKADKPCECPKKAEGHHCDKCGEGGCKCGEKKDKKEECADKKDCKSCDKK